MMTELLALIFTLLLQGAALRMECAKHNLAYSFVNHITDIRLLFCHYQTPFMKHIIYNIIN